MARRKKRSALGTIVASHDLPPELHGTLAPLLGDEVPLLESALQQSTPISIRLNTRKGFDPGGDAVPWCTSGKYLKERPAFTFDPLLHAGAYYVQEASSMFLEQAVRASGLSGKNIIALDLCAAPGGKSTHLRSLITAGSLLVVNEIERQRQVALQENMWKWGGPNVIVTQSTPRDLAGLPEFFDLILADAPCSGEGMFRKDPFAREQWSPELVRQCASVQRGIVENAWNALAPGGTLIYSTCTWEPAENEEQLVPLLECGGFPLDISIDPQWGIERSERSGIIGYRCYPHRLAGEGFFLAMIRKPGERSSEKRSATAKSDQPSLPFVKSGVDLFFTEMNGVQHAVDERWAPSLARIHSVLRTLAPGIPVSERKGSEWKPHPALALNALLDRTAIPEIALDHDQAIAYLKGEAWPASGAREIALAAYHGFPLGWLQGAGNRWNNRWPPAWRIRSRNPSASEVPWTLKEKA